MSENTSVSVYARVADPLAFAMQYGVVLAKSRMFGCETPEQGQVFALALLCENMTPIEIAKKYHLIQGRLAKRADAMLAEFREAGGRHRVIERTPEVAEIELIGREGESNRFRFTFEEAKGEKFPYGKDGKTLKDNWSTPRSRMQMLWARVVSDGIRCVMPEVVAGTYTPEEMKDVAGIGNVVVESSVLPASVSIVSADNQEVVEAEFSIVHPEGNQGNQSHSLDGLATPSSIPDTKPNVGQESFVEPNDGKGFATSEQLKELRELVRLLSIPPDGQDAILAKRKCQTWRNLTEEQAGELIAGMKAKLPN